VGYLQNILINKRSFFLNCLLGIVISGFFQTSTKAHPDVEVDSKLIIDSQTTLRSTNSKQETNKQNTVRKKQADSVQAEDKEPLDFTSLGRSGQQTAGESRGSCPYVDTPLTVIAPKSNLSLTTKSHPRLWFYLPYIHSKISKLEFSIVDQSGNDVTRYDLSVPENNSYISAVLPKLKPSLAFNSPYTWHLKVYCDIGKKTLAPPIFVSGALVRIANNSNDAKSLKFSVDNVQSLIDKDLWIDAVNILFDKNCREENGHKKIVWQDLLDSSAINLELPDPQSIE